MKTDQEKIEILLKIIDDRDSTLKQIQNMIKTKGKCSCGTDGACSECPKEALEAISK